MSTKSVLLSAFVFILVAGCESEQDSRIPSRDLVSGTVKFDGKPFSGSISFTSPEDIAKGIQASTSVREGKYELLVTPGKKQVKFSRVVETTKNVFDETVPKKYNLQTTLEADVNDDNKKFDFELGSR